MKNENVGVCVEDSDEFITLNILKEYVPVLLKMNELFDYQHFTIFDNVKKFKMFVKEHENEFRHGARDIKNITNVDVLEDYLSDYYEVDEIVELLKLIK